MRITESAVVSRKTPGDGKLEVSATVVRALGGTGSAVQVHIAEHELGGVVTAMECTCAKASITGKHEHHFVHCDAFRTLQVGAELLLQAERARLVVEQK